MKYLKYFIFISILLSSMSYAESENEIFNWVKQQLSNYETEQLEVPQIYYVSLFELQTIWLTNTRNSIKELENKIGIEKTNEIKNKTLKELIGLAIPDTQNIYVLKLLPTCKKNSIVAHELTHYIQIMNKGPISNIKDNIEKENRWLYDELQACDIEQKYMKEFCK